MNNNKYKMLVYSYITNITYLLNTIIINCYIFKGTKRKEIVI